MYSHIYVFAVVVVMACALSSCRQSTQTTSQTINASYVQLAVVSEAKDGPQDLTLTDARDQTWYLSGERIAILDWVRVDAVYVVDHPPDDTFGVCLPFTPRGEMYATHWFSECRGKHVGAFIDGELIRVWHVTSRPHSVLCIVGMKRKDVAEEYAAIIRTGGLP